MVDSTSEQQNGEIVSKETPDIAFLRSRIRDIPKEDLDRMLKIWQMKPLLEIYSLSMISETRSRDSTSWVVEVEWREPREGGEWNKFNGSGPVNRRFLDWARDHYEYWKDRGHVPIEVKSVRLKNETDASLSLW